MALIPSESLNFPDSFRASVGWRVPQKSPQPTPTARRTEPNRDKNGGSKTAQTPVDRTPSAQPAASTVASPQSERPKDKAAEFPKPPAEVKAKPESLKEEVKAEEFELELEEPKEELEAEELKLELEEPKGETQAEEPQKVAQEQLVTKPAGPPKVASAPPVETKPEQPREVPELSPNIAPAPVGATLHGTDAAALLSKIFFSPAAATDELEAIKSGKHSPESLAEPSAADGEAEQKSSPPPAPVSSQSASAPNKVLTTEGAKPVQPPRKEFSISAQPTSPFGEGLTDEGQSNTVNIQTPAQTRQVLDLIAAAAARGVLKAEPASTPPVTPAPAAEKAAAEIPAPSTTKANAEVPPTTEVLDEIAPGPERSVLNTPSVPTAPATATSQASAAPVEKPQAKPAAAQTNSPPSAAAATTAAVTGATSQPVAKTPAKIRIQPRKFKARPIPPPAAQTEFVEMEGDQETNIPDSIAYAAVGPDPAKKEPPPKPAYREWAEQGMPLPPRAEATGELFTPRDARNRWIRFGLGEAGALAVFVLLLSFLLNHKFPDPTLKLLISILMFAVGALAIALPVMFIRNHPSQWQRRALNYRRDHANYF